jgi:ketosteroid isomerase-like protein
MRILSPRFDFHRALRMVASAFVLAALALTCVSPAAAQKDKKKKPKDNAPADSTNPLVPMSDENQIDYTISEMLGAWQIGDVEKLHKDYADEVTIVNGAYAPPIIGWNNYLAVYQQQRARMQQVRMDRLNTLIKVSGNFAWACYQWDFSGTVDGTPTSSQGQTSLVMEKRNNHWIVVHNHTSMVPPGTPSTTTPAGTQSPATPGSSKPPSS